MNHAHTYACLCMEEIYSNIDSNLIFQIHPHLLDKCTLCETVSPTATALKEATYKVKEKEPGFFLDVSRTIIPSVNRRRLYLKLMQIANVNLSVVR